MIYPAIDADAIDAAAAKYLQPDQMVIVIVGGRKQIDDRLKALDMPIEYLTAEEL